MNSISPEYVLMSIFYERENWHKLLAEIRQKVFEQSQIQRELLKGILYLNLDRGPNVRLALQFKQPEKETYKIIAYSIRSFLKENPSENGPLKLPITGFFLDFGNNEIRYNLFDTRAILPGSLYGFQLLLSKILLIFFEDHPVDEDCLFTLMVHLQNAILNGICEGDEIKEKFCLEAMYQLRKNGNVITGNMIEIPDDPDSYPTESVFTTIPGLTKLLSDFQAASKLLYSHSGHRSKNYFTIWSIIQLHVFSIDGKIFHDSLEHIYCIMRNRRLNGKYQKILTSQSEMLMYHSQMLPYKSVLLAMNKNLIHKSLNDMKRQGVRFCLDEKMERAVNQNNEHKGTLISKAVWLDLDSKNIYLRHLLDKSNNNNVSNKSSDIETSALNMEYQEPNSEILQNALYRKELMPYIIYKDAMNNEAGKPISEKGEGIG